MRTRTLLLAGAAVGLLGVGIWLGRAASSSSQAPSSERRAQAPLTGAAPAVAVSSVRTAPPVLAHPTTAPSRALLADLADTDPKVRRAAVREVARDRDADPELLKAASRDADLAVAVVATSGLARLYARGQLSAQELVARATDHALDQRVRMTALNAFAETPSTEGAALLVELAARGDVFERSTAAILLAHQDEELAVPSLIRLLGDAEEAVRMNALDSLRSRSRGRDFGTNAGAWHAWWQSRPR